MPPTGSGGGGLPPVQGPGDSWEPGPDFITQWGTNMAKATGGTIAIFTGDMLLDGMGLFSTGWSTENYFKWGGHWVNVVTFIVEFHGASTRKERVGVVTKTAISFGIGVGAAAGLKKGGVAGAVTGPVGVVVVGLICAGVGALGGALGAW